MKARFFLPLTIFILITFLPLLIMIPPDYTIVFQYSLFILSLTITYFFGLKECIRNKDAVIKLKEKSPILIPFFMFAVPTIVITLFVIPKNTIMIIQFIFCFCGAAIAYFLGILTAIKYLKTSSKKITDKIEFSKSKKRLLLINPLNKNRSSLANNQSSLFPPIGLGIVAALTPDDLFDIKIIDENFEDFYYESADLVGITAFTSSAARAYEIASLYKDNNTPVVMGGIHASMMSEEALQYADSVVIGEAESSWPGLIKDFLIGRLQKIYKEPLEEFKNSVLPRRDLFNPAYHFASVQTSRGCPMDCHFCSVTAFNGKQYRQRPWQEVLDELEQIPERFIFFIDDNLIGHNSVHKARALSLFKGMVKRKLDKRWFCQSSLNFGTDKEVLKWARKAGCRMVFLGLESPDPEELEEMNKKVNQKLEYSHILKQINKYRIAVLGAFINGTDNETTLSINNKVKYIFQNNIDIIQTTILTPLPGTRLFKKLESENRLLYTNFPDDWARYDMSELTFQLKKMSAAEFNRENSKAAARLYSRFTLARLFIKTLINTRSIESAVWANTSNKNYRAATFNL